MKKFRQEVKRVPDGAVDQGVTGQSGGRKRLRL